MARYTDMELRAVKWYQDKTGFRLAMSLYPKIRFITPDGIREERNIHNLVTEYKADRKDTIKKKGGKR